MSSVLKSLCMAVLISSCNAKEVKETDTDNGSNNFASIKKNVFVPNCIACHGSSGGVNLETYESTQANLDKIRSAVLVNKTMPPTGSLSETQLSQLKTWLDAGGPEE